MLTKILVKLDCLCLADFSFGLAMVVNGLPVRQDMDMLITVGCSCEFANTCRELLETKLVLFGCGCRNTRKHDVLAVVSEMFLEMLGGLLCHIFKLSTILEIPNYLT